MGLVLANNACSTLAADLDYDDTVVTVQSDDAAKFPALSEGQWFPLVLTKADTSFEILKCTARDGALLTVVRAQEGTEALNFATGDMADLRLTKAAMAEKWDTAIVTGAASATTLDDDDDIMVIVSGVQKLIAKAALYTQLASELATTLDIAAINSAIGALQTQAGGLLVKANNLSDLADAGSARDNLGLGDIVTRNITVSSSEPSDGADGDIWFQVDE